MLRFVVYLFSTLILLAIIGVAAVLGIFWEYGRDLPDYHQLAHYEPPVTTRVYAGDGRPLAEYAVEKRSFVPISAIPRPVIDAFLAAEDKNFYTHPGVDFIGVLRAVLTNVKNRSAGSDRRPVGASTITQQVAKNFFLTNEATLDRKVKEAILAFRIERAFTKDHILELYLNEIYLGRGAYGVAAAAMTYFDKGLDELSVSEMAFLAALPKAPSNYNPTRFPDAARERRDWVIGRLYEDGLITRDQALAAQAEPLETRSRGGAILVEGGDYFAEDIRREISSSYGEQALYKGGLSVRSTMDPRLQAIATRTLKEGLSAYDRRHGWRGPLARIETAPGWWSRLDALALGPMLAPWMPAVVLSVNADAAEIGFIGGGKGRIPMAEMRWARPVLPQGGMGPFPARADKVLAPGDVVAVTPLKKGEDGKTGDASGGFSLRQIPKIEGALVAIDPHTGRVLAMQGGFAFQRSQFNRVTQAKRQPGSSFKPFVYMAALENGYTPSSLILDGPIELDQGPGLPKWTPKNYGGDYLGPTTLRVGIEKSRNLMTVRLAATLGLAKVADMAERFGVLESRAPGLSMALGSGETTPLRMAAAYAQIVNGGRKITPTLIDRVQDRTGKTVYRHDNRLCDGCQATFYTNQDMPEIPDSRAQVIDAISAYQMTHILEGVVERGTGRLVSQVGRPLAGKTGTSNDAKDAWFVGFSPDLAVAVFVGFDEPASLGPKETGSSVSAPIFRDFMAEALKDKPPTPFRIPPGVRLVRVDAATGRPAQPGDRNVIYEAFKPGTGYDRGDAMVVDNNDADLVGLGFGDLSGTGATDGTQEVPADTPSAGGTVAPAAPAAPSAAPPPQAGGLY